VAFFIIGFRINKNYQKEKSMRKLQISRFRTTAKQFAFDGCHKFYIFEDNRVKKEMTDEGWEEKEFYPIAMLPEMFNNCGCALRFIQRCTPYGGFQTIVPQFQEHTTFSWVNS